MKIIVQLIATLTILPNVLFAQSLEPGNSFSYDDYNRALASYVNESGLVNYVELKQNSADLDSFLDRISNLKTTSYESFSRAEKIAFWINAYNALTLKSIIDNYPIKSNFLKGLAFPKNSIRQIDGVWDKLEHKVLGQDRTLDNIEHQILREEFREARVHMALVCAAMSCPPLRNEAYTANSLEQQFENQTRKFLSSGQGLKLLKGNVERIEVSKIFKWFAKDFLWLYPEAENEKEAVLMFLKSSKVAGLDAANELDYLDYDWSLNEQ